MKNKTSKIITVCLSIIVAALLFALLALIFSPVSYYELEQDGYTFVYKGSFGMARKLIIKNGAEKICAVNISSDSDIFDSIDNFSVIIESLEGDDNKDFLIPTAHEEDGDIIYSAILFDGNKSDAYLANPTFESELGVIYTTETDKKIIEEGTKTSPEIYELTKKIAKHSLSGDTIITLEERAITYYAENDVYCYSIYQHSERTNALACVDEIWFDPIKLSEYPLDWD